MTVLANKDKRKFLVMSYFILIIAPLLIGPSRLFHLPNKPNLVAVGLFLGGMGLAASINLTVA